MLLANWRQKKNFTMESFRRSVVPLLNIFRLYGLEIFPSSNRTHLIHRFLVRFAGVFQFTLLITELILNYQATQFYNVPLAKLLVAFRNNATAIYSLYSRITFSYQLQEIMKMMNLTSKCFESFEEKEKLKLLKQLRQISVRLFAGYCIIFTLYGIQGIYYSHSHLNHSGNWNSRAAILSITVVFQRMWFWAQLGFMTVTYFYIKFPLIYMESHLKNGVSSFTITNSLKLVELHRNTFQIVQCFNQIVRNILLIFISIIIYHFIFFGREIFTGNSPDFRSSSGNVVIAAATMIAILTYMENINAIVILIIDAKLNN
ncbi:hypothetical protein CHUAL_009942 [Chamberlinius hualienensis]